MGAITISDVIFSAVQAGLVTLLLDTIIKFHKIRKEYKEDSE